MSGRIGDMVNVDILENQKQGNTLTSRVIISHEETASVDYTVEIGLVGGPSETVSGTLPSSTGSFPGGSDTQMVEFDLGGVQNGTVYAEVISGGSDRSELAFGSEDKSYYAVDGDEGLSGEELALLVGGVVGAGLVVNKYL